MKNRTFQELVQLMETLRGPDGCPWDRQQKLEDLKPFIIEEAYEVVDAIDRGDRDLLREEIGDLLLEAVFTARIAEENGWFSVEDSITAIHDKLVRRHPHVFGDVVAADAEAVLENWEKQKQAERHDENKSLLDGLPISLPALLKAGRLTEKAARVGFDWERTDDVFAKLDEEVAELRAAIESEKPEAIEQEVGDLFFTLANIARKLKVNAEEALQGSNRKFTRRFQFMEAALRERGKKFDDVTLGELDRLWDEAKKSEE
jgi:tetrapyrrole methylase family protein/MazG family protein